MEECRGELLTEGGMIYLSYSIRVEWGRLAYTLDAITNSGKSLAELVEEAAANAEHKKKGKTK